MATTSRASKRKIGQLRKKGVEVEVFSPDENGRVPLGELTSHLGQRGIQHLLIEGGSRIFTAAWEAGEVDKFMLFFAPLLLGGKNAPGLFGGRGAERPSEGLPVFGLRTLRSGRDVMLEGYTRPPGTRFLL